MDEIAKLRAEALLDEFIDITNEEKTSATNALSKKLENGDIFANVNRDIYNASYTRMLRNMTHDQIEYSKQNKFFNWIFGSVSVLFGLYFMEQYFERNTFLILPLFVSVGMIIVLLVVRKENSDDLVKQINFNLEKHNETLKYFYDQGSRGFVAAPSKKITANQNNPDDKYTANDDDLGFDVPPQD